MRQRVPFEVTPVADTTAMVRAVVSNLTAAWIRRILGSFTAPPLALFLHIQDRNAQRMNRKEEKEEGKCAMPRRLEGLSQCVDRRLNTADFGWLRLFSAVAPRKRGNAYRFREVPHGLFPICLSENQAMAGPAVFGFPETCFLSFQAETYPTHCQQTRLEAARAMTLISEL